MPSYSLIGSCVNPNDGAMEPTLVEGAPKKSGGSNKDRRKYTQSLTDKYQGGFEELLYRPPAVVVNSSHHVSSSDGCASYIVPSENERMESNTGRVRDGKIINDTVTSFRAKAGKLVLSGVTSASIDGHHLKQHPLTNFVHKGASTTKNIFHMEPSATFIQRRKSSQEKGAILPQQLS